MRDAIAWSYDLLAPEEQVVFRRLAVFAGGFTLDAAEAVVPSPDEPPLDVLGGVTSLVDKSLLQVVEDRTAGGPRCRMLETIREFAAERLETTDERASVRGRHAAWMAVLAERTAPLLGPISVDGLALLGAEHDNARAALRWTIDTGAVETGLRIATGFERLWHIRGYLAEGRSGLGASLGEVVEHPRELRTAALFGPAGWRSSRGRRTAEARSSRCWSVRRAGVDDAAASLALTGLGSARWTAATLTRRARIGRPSPAPSERHTTSAACCATSGSSRRPG
jgi:hypothetical protein